MDRPVCRPDGNIRGLWKGSISVVIDFCVYETHQTVQCKTIQIDGHIRLFRHISSMIIRNTYMYIYIYNCVYVIYL